MKIGEPAKQECFLTSFRETINGLLIIIDQIHFAIFGVGTFSIEKNLVFFVNRHGSHRPLDVIECVVAGCVDRAAKLRNRAQEIARRDGCSFTAAFRLAEQEIVG